MSWIVPLGSSMLGAITGGLFLLGGQHYNLRLTRRSIRRIILAESLRNLDGLLANVDSILQSNNQLPVQVTLSLKIDAFLRHEEDLASESLADLQMISRTIGTIQIAKLKSLWWTPTSHYSVNKSIPESRDTLVGLIEDITGLVDLLSKGMAKKDLDSVGKSTMMDKAKERVELFRNTQQAFILVPPYEEWPLSISTANPSGGTL